MCSVVYYTIFVSYNIRIYFPDLEKKKEMSGGNLYKSIWISSTAYFIFMK